VGDLNSNFDPVNEGVSGQSGHEPRGDLDLRERGGKGKGNKAEVEGVVG